MNTNPIFFQALVEQIGQGFFAFDVASMQFTYMSPAFRANFKIPEQSLNESALLGLVHSDDQNYVKEIIRILLSKKKCPAAEFRVLLPEQDEQWVCVHFTLLEFTPGQHLVCGHAEDVTANRLYNDHLKKFSNKKNSVLNILSHDLAGPLGMIRNLSSLLAEQFEESENEETKHLIHLIEQTSKHGSELLQNFMSQEFMESTQTDLVTRRVNVVEKMQHLVEEYQGERGDLVAKEFRFLCEREEIYAEIDDLKFMQVLTNLISNALKFTPDGGLITITLEDESDYFLVKVADNGIGIPKQYHDSLFDKFTEARRPGLKGERSVGLGMSIVKIIIDWHHGEIWFESEENQGTTFYIRIPKAAA